MAHLVSFSNIFQNVSLKQCHHLVQKFLLHIYSLIRLFYNENSRSRTCVTGTTARNHKKRRRQPISRQPRNEKPVTNESNETRPIMRRVLHFVFGFVLRRRTPEPAPLPPGRRIHRRKKKSQ